MEDYKRLYTAVKEEYDKAIGVNRILGKKVDSLYNIVEISNYINMYLRNENLMDMINDMIIGILGVTYSTIFIVEGDKLKIKSTNKTSSDMYITDSESKYINNYQEFLVNSVEPIKTIENPENNIHSVIGMPVKLRNKILGYILVEHKIYNSLIDESKLFLKSIANQVAIAIENSLLYNQLKQMTERDPLLGIYNRKYFFNYLEEKIVQESDKRFALVMVDLDDFKKVNDTYGHQFGDEALRTAAKVLKSNIDTEDIVARYGGEEIILCIEDYDTEDNLYENIENMRSELENTDIVFNNIKSSITGSFGIAVYPTDGKNVIELIRHADNLLYESKRKGKNTVMCKHF
ncbi:MAG: sensor domain-containing diguanylate cyclase [Clostridium sp.]|nr:sensor domain-containing diguanylate cyclase [Clostridium sp.]